MDVERLFCELDRAAAAERDGGCPNDRAETLAAVAWWLVQEVSAHNGVDLQAAVLMVSEMARSAVAEMSAPATTDCEARRVH